MKVTITLMVGAVVLAAAGAVLLATASVERLLADAQQHVATLKYADAQASLAKAEGYLGYGTWLPGIGSRAGDDVRARKAALQYWQRDYAALVPEGGDPVGAIEGSTVDLQIVVANAAHRLGESRSTDRATTLQALDESASAYLSVLKNNAAFPEDAAYTYEYIIRLRDELRRGRRPPPSADSKEDGDMGQSGAPSESTSQQGFEIYVPLEGQERPQGGDAGKTAPKERKG
jgi:hypothetical protein